MGQFREAFDVKDLKRRIRDRFTEDEARIFVKEGGYFLVRHILADEADLDAKFPERHGK
ncbi:hypothetical protein SDC9_162648 [bioreactor metagenome]|uniref:Uncharacterized protein n=1 Tax=bioreactor metagenome TaxID=1076179 RepID=A0A645FLN1_9ZZZZ